MRLVERRRAGNAGVTRQPIACSPAAGIGHVSESCEHTKKALVAKAARA